MFVKKQNFVVAEGEGATVHPKAVDVEVTWSEPAIAAGSADADSDSVAVSLKVQPELKFPVNGAKGLQWTQSDAVHPFWFIQRTDTNEMEANADLVMQAFARVMACDFKAVPTTGAPVRPTTDTFSLTVPCIVNAGTISMGEEAESKWKPSENKRKHGAGTATVFDQLRQEEKKQRRAKPN